MVAHEPWKMLLLLSASLLLSGCELSSKSGTSLTRLLTTGELDQITAGTATASVDITAKALPPAATTAASTETIAIAGSYPAAAPPFLSMLSTNYSMSQGAGSAASGELAETTGSSRTAVVSANGGAAVDASGASIAAGGGIGQTQLSFQFQGFSTARADLVYGTAVATACCAPVSAAQVTVDSQTGGPYSAKLESQPVSEQPGQVQSRVDIAVVSSALPIIDPGQAMVLLTPRGSPLY
jgi:hypothetical protein